MLFGNSEFLAQALDFDHRQKPSFRRLARNRELLPQIALTADTFVSCYTPIRQPQGQEEEQ